MNRKFKDRTIKLLGEIICRESAKSDHETDYALIEECEELLQMLTRDDVALSEEEIEKRIRSITQNQRSDKQVQNPKKRVSRLHAILRAAKQPAVIVLITCSMVFAFAMCVEGIRNALWSTIVSLHDERLSAENVSKDTSPVVDAAGEPYYENVSRFLMFYDENGVKSVVHDYRRIGDRYYVLYSPQDSMHMRLAEFTLDGKLCGEKIASDQIIGSVYSIYDPDSIIIMMPDNIKRVMYLKRYNFDGELLETSFRIGRYPVGSAQRLLVLDDGCVCFADGQDLWFFDDLTKKPLHVDAPCTVDYMEKVADDEYRVFGWKGKTGTYIIGTVYPKEQKSEQFRYSEEMENANGLFEKTLYSAYMRGEYYGVCAEGLYVYRDGAPQKLVDWMETDLDVTKVKLLDVLSDSAFMVQYENALDISWDIGFLARVTEERTKPRQTLTVASIGLEGEVRGMIYAAVNQFNLENDEYKIYYKDYMNFSAIGINDSYRGATKERLEQAQESFVLDLINGVVYDCYIFPEKAQGRKILQDKGLLADLRPMIPDNTLFSCAQTAYAEQSGTYGLPLFMNVQTLITTQNILPSTKSLTWDILYQMADELGPGESLCPDYIYDQIVTVGQNKFINYDEKTCSFDSEEFTKYAEFAAKIANGEYYDIRSTVIHGFHRHNSIDQDFSVGEMHSQNHITLKHTRFLPFELNSPDSIAAVMYAFKQDQINYCGYPYENGTAVVLSSSAVFSMTSIAENPAGCKAFLDYLISNRVQTSRSAENCGLPVSRDALKDTFRLGYYNYEGPVSGPADDDFNNTFPDAVLVQVSVTDEPMSERDKTRDHVFDTVLVTEEDRDRLLRFFNRMKGITAADGVAEEILKEELSRVSA
ncbi:MAG: hypothetical protein MJ175_11865, partial [Clostridia bacterium]|nr:hypothetical protein [Clostridia bacterium]